MASAPSQELEWLYTHDKQTLQLCKSIIAGGLWRLNGQEVKVLQLSVRRVPLRQNQVLGRYSQQGHWLKPGIWSPPYMYDGQTLQLRNRGQ